MVVRILLEEVPQCSNPIFLKPLRFWSDRVHPVFLDAPFISPIPKRKSGPHLPDFWFPGRLLATSKISWRLTRQLPRDEEGIYAYRQLIVHCVTVLGLDHFHDSFLTLFCFVLVHHRLTIGIEPNCLSNDLNRVHGRVIRVEDPNRTKPKLLMVTAFRIGTCVDSWSNPVPAVGRPNTGHWTFANVSYQGSLWILSLAFYAWKLSRSNPVKRNRISRLDTLLILSDGI
jgi:hypothetical protein